MATRSGLMKAASRVAWLVALFAYVLSVVLAVANEPSGGLSAELVAKAIENLSFLTIATLALLILRTQSANKVAWAMMLVGVTFPVEEFYAQLTEYALAAWGQAGIALFAGWVSRWVWIGTPVTIPLILLYYPDGRLPSSRWRPIVPAIWSIVVITFLFAALDPTPIMEFGDLPNPLGIDALGRDIALFSGIRSTANWGLFMLPISGALSLIPRYRRSTGVGRQQMKVIAWVGAVALFYLLLLRPAFETTAVTDAVFNTLFTLFVGAALTAGIVRYRVFEIDRIISRSISYTVVVTLLASAFFGAVTGITTLLPTDSSLAVAGSTLAVAALFNPLRRRIQHAVDRRFNRARYQARAISEGFTTRLQEARSIESIADDWTETVVDALQPEAIGVWIKETITGP